MDEDIINRFNFTDLTVLENEDIKHKNDLKNVPGLPKISQIKLNSCLGQNCIPNLGQYGDEYQWINPTMSMRCFPMDNNQKKKMVLNLLPNDFVFF